MQGSSFFVRAQSVSSPNPGFWMRRAQPGSSQTEGHRRRRRAAHLTGRARRKNSSVWDGAEAAGAGEHDGGLGVIARARGLPDRQRPCPLSPRWRIDPRVNPLQSPECRRVCGETRLAMSGACAASSMARLIWGSLTGLIGFWPGKSLTGGHAARHHSRES